MTKLEEINLYGVSNEPTKITENAMRTEQDILKDFEKLGYVVKVNSGNTLILTFNEYYTIIIQKWFRTYRAVYVSLYEEVSVIGMKEHLLLHELFKCWGWI